MPKYQYSFDTADSTLDSIALEADVVYILTDTQNCDSIDTLEFLFSYYIYTDFDTGTGLPTDSMLVNFDTSLSLYLSDTLEFINPDTTSLWVDNYVYINNSYPIEPPSIGVATFDGLDQFGTPYSSIPFFWGPADCLTSKPINFDADTITIGDSVYLSFWYQGKGHGDIPNPEDSLTLEFYGKDSIWHNIWSVPGDSTAEFEQVLIPVRDSLYFFDAFQFRFLNYASLSGNNDHWHLDYVILDENRTDTNFFFRDIAVSVAPTTILKNYFEMKPKIRNSGLYQH